MNIIDNYLKTEDICNVTNKLNLSSFEVRVLTGIRDQIPDEKLGNLLNINYLRISQCRKRIYRRAQAEYIRGNLIAF